MIETKVQVSIKLRYVYWTSRACDGTFCKMPYPDHPQGCPNFPECIYSNQIEAGKVMPTPTNHPPIVANELIDVEWWAVIEEFDLEAHAKRMKELHPAWSERQCKCVLYWQNSVRKRLREKAEKVRKEVKADLVTLCPESLGINVFGTMARAGLILYKNPKIVRKIAFVGKTKKEQLSPFFKFLLNNV